MPNSVPFGTSSITTKAPESYSLFAVVGDIESPGTDEWIYIYLNNQAVVEPIRISSVDSKILRN